MDFNLYDPVYINTLYGDCTNPENNIPTLGIFVGTGYINDPETNTSEIAAIVFLTEECHTSYSIYPVEFIAVNASLVHPAKWYVNIFLVEDVDNEEYKKSTIVDSFIFDTELQANEYMNHIQRINSYDKNYSIVISNLPGKNFPSEEFVKSQTSNNNMFKRIFKLFRGKL